MLQPILSIITVCYNAERDILRTLLSVAEQTYPHIEYIVIDGGSTDRTLALVAEYAPGAVVLSEPDRGIYDAMNKGLARATGDYVWYINAGDALYAPETASLVAHRIASAEHRPDVVYGDCMLIGATGAELGLRRLRPPRELSWRSFRWGMLVCHQSFVARRALCSEYDLRYRFSSDVDWCIRVMRVAQHYEHIDAPISRYLNEGATTANHRRSLSERFAVMRRHYGLLSTLVAHLWFALRLALRR